MKIESIFPTLSALIAIVLMILFNYLFPSADKYIIIIIGISFIIYGLLISLLSYYNYSKIKEIPTTLNQINEVMSGLITLNSSHYVLPLEMTLNFERAVTTSVSVVTHDLKFNIDEMGNTHYMYDTIVHNLKRGVVYNYYVFEASETRQDLRVLHNKLKDDLSDTPAQLDNLNVYFIDKFPLLFSFAMFDVDIPGAENRGFIFIHTLDDPIAIPLNQQTFSLARDIYLSVSGI